MKLKNNMKNHKFMTMRKVRLHHSPWRWPSGVLLLVEEEKVYSIVYSTLSSFLKRVFRSTRWWIGTGASSYISHSPLMGSIIFFYSQPGSVPVQCPFRINNSLRNRPQVIIKVSVAGSFSHTAYFESIDGRCSPFSGGYSNGTLHKQVRECPLIKGSG